MSGLSISIPIAISFANCHGISFDEICDYISENAGDASLYTLCPGTAGESRKSGADVYLILDSVASIATIGGFLWLAYDKYIASKKEPGSDAGIYIVIGKPDGSSMKLWVGRDVLTKGDFDKKWEIEVESFLTIDPSSFPEQITEITRSPDWIKR